MPNQRRPEGWVDFETVKKTVPFDVVLSTLGLLNQLRQVGDEIRGRCPLCEGERSFAANPVKGVSNCFRCRKGGDVIDFVAAYQKVEKKQAAAWLAALISPVEEEIPAQDTEVEHAPSALGLTAREVRLLQLMAKAHARYVAAIFSYTFNSASEQLEGRAWQIVKEEIEQEFPGDRLSHRRDVST